MKKEVRAFIRSKDKLKIFDYPKKRNATVDFFYWNNLFAIFRFYIFFIFRFFPMPGVTPFLYRLFGVKIGKNVFIGADVIIDPFYPYLIEIGDDCTLGWGTRILAHEGYLRHFRLGRVKIGNNCLIGSFSTIRSGVELEKDVIVAMGAVVDKDVPKNEVVGGVPEHEIKKLRTLL